MAHHELRLDNDQSSIRVRAGDTIDVWLDENPTTGYGWVIETGRDNDEGFTLLTSVFHPPKEGRIGQGGRRQLSLRAGGPGQVRLRFALRRPWESPQIAATTRHLDLEIFPASSPN